MSIAKRRKESPVWFKEYKDYPIDAPLKKERLEPSQGFNGCEMHELNGWGTSYDLPQKPPNFFGNNKVLARIRTWKFLRRTSPPLKRS